MSMAYAYQKNRDRQSETLARSKVRWFIGYKNEAGKHVQMATRASSKAEALRLATELEQRAERVRLGLEVAPPKSLLFSDFADRCEREVYSLKRGHSITHYRIKRLKADFKGLHLGQIGVEQAQAFAAALTREGKKPNTVNAYLATLQGIFRLAIKWKLATSNPLKDVDRPEVAPTEPRYLELEEIRRLLAVVPEHWRPITATALLTGMRTGELAGLRPENVDLAGRTIRVVHNYDVAIPKGGRMRRVVITDELLPFISQALERTRGGDRVFLSIKGRHLIPNNGLARNLRKWAKAAGIPAVEGQLLQFRHLRSTYGTHAAEQAGIRFAQGALGHSTVGVTERHYAGRRSAAQAEAAQRLRIVTDPALTPAPKKTPRKGRKA